MRSSIDDIPDISQQTQSQQSQKSAEVQSKHERFNLRKINLPPLNKDHQRINQKLKNGSKNGYQNKISENSSDLNLKTGSHQETVNDGQESSEESEDTYEIRIQKQKEEAEELHRQLLQDIGLIKQSLNPQLLKNEQQNSQDNGMRTRRQTNLKENKLKIEEDSYNDSFMENEQNSRVAGRWTHEEHSKFIEAINLFGRDWKKVEQHIGTRSGAQIRSHAQKFFTKIEKEYHGDIDGYIKKKAMQIQQKGSQVIEKDYKKQKKKQKQSLFKKLKQAGTYNEPKLKQGKSLKYKPTTKPKTQKPIQLQPVQTNHSSIQPPKQNYDGQLDIEDEFQMQLQELEIEQIPKKEIDETDLRYDIQKVILNILTNYDEQEAYDLCTSDQLFNNIQEIENQIIEDIEAFLNKFNEQKFPNPKILATKINSLQQFLEVLIPINDQVQANDPLGIDIKTQKLMRLIIQIENNIQLLHQTQDFLGITYSFEIGPTHKPVRNDVIPNFNILKEQGCEQLLTDPILNFQQQMQGNITPGNIQNHLVNMLSSWGQQNNFSLQRELINLFHNNRSFNTDWMDRSLSHEQVNERSLNNLFKNHELKKFEQIVSDKNLDQEQKLTQTRVSNDGEKESAVLGQKMQQNANQEGAFQRVRRSHEHSLLSQDIASIIGDQGQSQHLTLSQLINALGLKSLTGPSSIISDRSLTLDHLNTNI